MLTCLFNCLANAFGNAVAFALAVLVASALIGLFGGGPGGMAIMIGAALAPVFAMAFIYLSVSFIGCAVNCVVAAAETAAAAPGGATQNLNEDDEGKPWPTCKRCRWMQKYVAGAASAAAVAIYMLYFYRS